jgi:hypothetical protein
MWYSVVYSVRNNSMQRISVHIPKRALDRHESSSSSSSMRFDQPHTQNSHMRARISTVTFHHRPAGSKPQLNTLVHHRNKTYMYVYTYRNSGVLACTLSSAGKRLRPDNSGCVVDLGGVDVVGLGLRFDSFMVCK